MNAYIQASTKNALNKEIASMGLFHAGYFVEDVEVIESSFLANTDNVYYGNVNWMTNIIERLGYRHLRYGEVPGLLLPFAGREIKAVFLATAFNVAREKKVFIKPITGFQKAFDGMILDTTNQQCLIEVANYKLNDFVLMSDVIEGIKSEWRCFILNNEIAGAQCYKGDFKVHPDYVQVQKMVEAYTKPITPAAYGLDVYVTDKGTFVMEVNDAMCLGWYGLTPSIAGRMLGARWEQIHKNKST